MLFLWTIYYLENCQYWFQIRDGTLKLTEYIVKWLILALSSTYTFFIPYIFVMGRQWCFLWGQGGFGSFNIRPPHPNDPVGIDLTPTPIPAANLRIHTRRKQKKKMTTEKALYIILQQPIRAKLYWWLLNLSFKNREATLLCFFATMGSLFSYLFIPVCIPSFFPPFFFFKSIFTLRKKKFKKNS